MILLITFVLYRQELLCPPVLAALMFTFTSVFGLLNYRDFDYASFHWKAAALIILGLVSFILAGFLPYLYFRKKYGLSGQTGRFSRRKRIDIGFLWILFLVFEIVEVVICYRFIRRTVSSYGMKTATLSLIIYNYRRLTQFLVKTYTPIYISLGKKISELLVLISTFILCHNLCFRAAKRKDFLHVLIIGFGVALQLLFSSRGFVLQVLAIALYTSYYFLNMLYGWRRRADRRILWIGVFALGAFIVAFLFLGVFLGRFKSLESINVAVYLSRYICFGIRNFDLYLKKPVSQGVFGQELFYSLYASVFKFFGIGTLSVRNLEFRYINGVDMGNVYTAFRRFYSMGGAIGIVIFSALEGFIFTWGYMVNQVRGYAGKISFNFLLFAYFSYAVFYLPIDDVFFSKNISVGVIPRIMILYALYLVLVEKKIVFKLRKAY